MTIGDAIRRFETRALWLTVQAWIFLLLVLVLLGAGGAAVWFAPSITAGDIGTVSQKKVEAIQAAHDKAVARIAELEKSPLRFACTDALAVALKDWPAQTTPRALNFPFRAASVTGDELVSIAEGHLNTNIFLLNEECGLSRSGQFDFAFSVPKDRFAEFKNQMAGKVIISPELRASENELQKLRQRENQLEQLRKQVELERLQSEVGNSHGAVLHSFDNSTPIADIANTFAQI